MPWCAQQLCVPTLHPLRGPAAPAVPPPVPPPPTTLPPSYSTATYTGCVRRCPTCPSWPLLPPPHPRCARLPAAWSAMRPGCRQSLPACLLFRAPTVRPRCPLGGPRPCPAGRCLSARLAVRRSLVCSCCLLLQCATGAGRYCGQPAPQAQCPQVSRACLPGAVPRLPSWGCCALPLLLLLLL